MTTPPPNDVNLNALWSRLIAEELSRAGVRTAVLCPGSRNSPLLFALAAHTHAISHTDERSAGFIALGIAKATGFPAAVCVTSGSALANLLPAITEAHAAHLPLIVVAADRPWEMHDNGSSQSMPQRGIFAQFLAAELAVGEATATPGPLRALRAQVSRIAQIRTGPVMINVPLRDPLPPLPDPAWKTPDLPADLLAGRGGDWPFTEVVRGATKTADLPAHWDWLRPGLSGVIVAGASDGDNMSALGLSEITGFPLIADAAGWLRPFSSPSTNVIACADALLGGALGASKPDLVIQVGAAPLARVVYEWLGRQDCPWLAIENGRNQDMLGRAWASVPDADAAFWKALSHRLSPGDPAWTKRWRHAEASARAALKAAMAEESWNEVLAAHLSCTQPGYLRRHLASSMAVRHANLHLQPNTSGPELSLVTANRGVSGIDGTIGTFIGLLLGLINAQKPGKNRSPLLPPPDDIPPGQSTAGLLLVGDLAFLHDLPALASAKIPGLRGAIVILNNDGGAIFDYLAVSQVLGYQDWVRTPHGADFKNAAAQAGLPYVAVSDRAALTHALTTAATAETLMIIECKVAGGDTPSRHRALLKRMANAAENPEKT